MNGNKLLEQFCEICKFARDNEDLIEKLEKLEAENKILREALGFYADHKNHLLDDHEYKFHQEIGLVDCKGKRARKVLAQINNGVENEQ